MNWNSFHEALFWANGGRLRSNSPRRQEEKLLALNLRMDAIVYYTVDEHGAELRKGERSHPGRLGAYWHPREVPFPTGLVTRDSSRGF